MSEEIKGLGRYYAPDERDQGYLLRSAAGRVGLDSLPNYRYWRQQETLDQNGYPRCVGYRWKTLLLNSPVRQISASPTPDEIYNYAQRNDVWPGEDYDGTSVRAGAKACVSFGAVTEYRWAFTMDDVLNWILQYGPLVVGTAWHDGMYEPDADGYIWPTGSISGGHCYGITGGNREQQKLRVHNNWGLDWGTNGLAWMTFDAFESLLTAGGEACSPTEVIL